MSENKTNNLNNTRARYEFISFENTQRITDPSEASNKNFFCRKTSNFNGSCNVTLHLWCDINIYINGVCSYVCRWKNYRWQHLILIGSRQMPPFFRRCGHLRTPTQVSEDFKHQSKIEQYYSSRIRRFWVRTGIQIQHPPGSVLGEKQSRIDQMVLEDFSKIIEAILLDSMWPGTDPVKRVHLCWGPALSFFYCTDLCFSNTWEILLMASVNTFYNRLK